MQMKKLTVKRAIERCLTFTDCRLQITDCNRGTQTVDYTEKKMTEDRWLHEDGTELNPIQIVVVLKTRLFDHVKDDMVCVDSETLKKDITTYDNEPFSLQ